MVVYTAKPQLARQGNQHQHSTRLLAFCLVPRHAAHEYRRAEDSGEDPRRRRAAAGRLCHKGNAKQPPRLPAYPASASVGQRSEEDHGTTVTNRDRAFYRWQLLNCVAMFPRTRQLNLLGTTFKAWCLCVTWTPWEVCKIETVHAYFRHQYELILDAVNADFIHRLEAMATPDCPDTDDW